MTIIQPGDFWVADIPFTDGGGSKKRPILVLWLDGDDIVALLARIGRISEADAEQLKQV